MSEEQIDINDVNVYGGSLSRLTPSFNKLRNRRLIKAADVSEITKVMTLGGDCADDNSQPPSIIIERNGDQITKIIVKCACGRHAELVCEVDEDETPLIEEKTGE
jgi:hypothetical protein